MSNPRIDALIMLLARLPGLGPRSARRATLHLLRHPNTALRPLGEALLAAADSLVVCSYCGTVDVTDPCSICADPARANQTVCVVEQIGDLWAIERTGAFLGRYHVLGGTLSALDGIGPSELGIDRLQARIEVERVREVILALNGTVEGQTTAHYIADRLEPMGCQITRLARGVPIGGELDYLDDGTLTAAFRDRGRLEGT
jgi:recombination protein RecR